MSIITKKEQIIVSAAKLINKSGYHHVGINSILKELGIPKGSFYNYFESKEDLAVSIIGYHIQNTKKIFYKSTENQHSIEGLKSFFTAYFDSFKDLDYCGGCPIGNLILELSDQSEKVRNELLKWIEFLENEIYQILCAESQSSTDLKSLSSFIVSAFEGVIMKAKAEKNSKALDEFHHIIFEVLLNN
jgi:TetR/AcrR family transcriptional repressor of nem operon